MSDTQLPQATQIPSPKIRHTHNYSQDKYHSTLKIEASVASETLAGYLSSELDGVMFQKTLTLVFTAMRTSDTSTNTDLSQPPRN